jgi:hypothetical protein
MSYYWQFFSVPFMKNGKVIPSIVLKISYRMKDPVSTMNGGMPMVSLHNPTSYYVNIHPFQSAEPITHDILGKKAQAGVVYGGTISL